VNIFTEEYHLTDTVASRCPVADDAELDQFHNFIYFHLFVIVVITFPQNICRWASQTVDAANIQV